MRQAVAVTCVRSPGSSGGGGKAEIQGLLANPIFPALVKEYRSLEDLPEMELLRWVASHARFLLKDALTKSHVGVAVFLLHQTNRGRNPARPRRCRPRPSLYAEA